MTKNVYFFCNSYCYHNINVFVFQIMSRTRVREDRSRSPVSNHANSESSSDFPCQIGCGAHFSGAWERTRHERFRCPKLDETVPGTRLPPHEDLGLHETDCRICPQTASRKDNAKQHEIRVHKVKYSNNGIPYLPRSSTLTVRNPSLLPTSHPPSQAPVILEPPEGLIIEDVNFTEVLVNFTDVIARTGALCSNDPNESSSNSSSTSVPQSMPIALSTSVPFCLTTFQSRRGQVRHECNFDLNDENGNLPIILQPPKNFEETLEFLEMNLCVSDIIALCRLQNWALKGYWPLVFPGRGHSVPLLSEYTAGSKSDNILSQLIKDNQVVYLPKKIIIEDNSRNLTALLRESMLEPRSYSFTTGPYDFVVTGRTQSDQNPVTSHNMLTVQPIDATLAQDFIDTGDQRENDDNDSQHSSHSSETQTASPQSGYANHM